MIEKKSTLDDIWWTFETQKPDPDDLTIGDWIDDIRRSDLLTDMDDATMKELLKLVAKNYRSSECQHLRRHFEAYIEDTIECGFEDLGDYE